MSKNIDSILELGDDAMQNQFELAFIGGIPGGGDGTTIALRMDTSIDPPEDVVGTYTINYKGMKIEKTNRTDETDKNITMDVRVDQKWAVYDDLVKWKNMSYNSATGTSAPDLTTRGTLSISSLDGDDKIVKTFLFKNVKLKSLKISEFSQEGTEPAKLTLGFIFGSFEPA